MFIITINKRLEDATRLNVVALSLEVSVVVVLATRAC